MDHTHIDESNLAERYVTGRLGANERADFEAHFVDCSECLDRIEAAEGLQRGISVLKPREHVRRPTAFFAGRWQGPALALAASVIVVLSIALAMTLRARSRAEAQWEAARLAAASLEKRLSDEQVAGRQEREARDALAEQLARAKKPQLPIPVFALIPTRGDETETLPLPAAAQWIVISLERESPPRFDRYQISLLSSDGKKLWQGEAPPSSRETLAFGLHSSLLPPGVYVFQLLGVTRTGRRVPLERHTVRVVTVSSDAGPAMR